MWLMVFLSLSSTSVSLIPVAYEMSELLALTIVYVGIQNKYLISIELHRVSPLATVQESKKDNALSH